MYTRTCAVYRAWLDLLRMVESNTLCNKTKTFHSGEVFHCIFPLNFVVVIFYWSVWYLVASVPFVHFDFMLFTFNSYWQTSSSPDRIRMWSLSAATNKLFFPRESRNNTKTVAKFFLGSFWNVAKNVPDSDGKTTQTLSIYLNNECILSPWRCKKSIEIKTVKNDVATQEKEDVWEVEYLRAEE